MPSLSAVRAVVRLALPAVGNSLLQTLVFLVDRIILGHHASVSLAAMQTAGPLIWTLFSVFGAFAIGTVAVVGRCVGAGDAKGAQDAARGSFLVATVLGIVVTAGATLGLHPMLSALGGDSAVQHVAAAYLRVMIFGLPLFLVGLTGISVLQAAGDTRTPFAIGVFTNAVNLVLNWLLVFGRGGAPRLGATGSAVSSTIAALLECVLVVMVLARARSPVALRWGSFASSVAGARRVVSVAWGSWGERIIYHAGYLLFVVFVVELGEAAMAANQALISVESISFLTADGVAIAASTLVARHLGAGEPHQARTAAWISTGLCVAVLGACGVMFVLIPGPLIRVFRDDPMLVAVGAPALRVGALAQIPMAISVVLAQSMRGAGATREALAVSFLGALVVRIAATYTFVRVLHLGLAGVWLGSTCDWFVRATVYVWRWRAGRWARVTV